MTAVRAQAHSNIALAKYWGKADVEKNLPAVPSLSMTLAGMTTTTTVELDDALSRDDVVLDGVPAGGRPRDRVITLLDRVRRIAGVEAPVRVISENDFPTAAGLASSASGFAALALASTTAFGLGLEPGEVSSIARASSASAARSLFGGFVALGAGAEQAHAVAGPEHFDVTMLVAVTASGPKSIGSTEGMIHTAKTSPYYRAWVEHSPAVFEQVRAGVLGRDLDLVGSTMEQSALMMHASMMAARPAVFYWTAASVAAMNRVREVRAGGTPAYFTMDGGPHVKVLTRTADASSVRSALEDVAGVERVLSCPPGGPAKIVS